MSANLVFSGKLGSGKTKKLVAERIGARWNSFGNTVKRIAQERGIPFERRALQEIGEDLVTNSPEAFRRRVIAGATPNLGNGFVLDGLRHVSSLRQLELLLPAPVICVFITVEEATRRDRIARRGGVDLKDLDQLEAHSTEVQVMKNLYDAAQVRVDNSGSALKAVQEILGWLSARNF